MEGGDRLKLTKNLKRVIVTQFKGGEDMAYLATLYGLPLERVEDTIREAMREQEQKEKEERIDGNERGTGNSN